MLSIFGFSLLQSQAQVPQINEFLAVNVKGAVDEDGTVQPWIEIYNPQVYRPGFPAVVSMAGYKLTDGTTTWNFPTVQIMPDDRLLVWASGKNRTVVTAPLHTNFTIPATGGTLSLLNSANTVVSSFINYPAQTADVSWGRDISDVNTTVSPPATSVVGDKTAVGFYKTPTPGEANNFTGDGVAGEVVFSIPSKAFASTDTMSLTLTPAVADPDAVIRFTLSTTNATVAASIPSATSPIYTTPLNITATTLVRARIFKTGKLPGATGTRGYLLLNANAVSFTSTMPIVVVSNFTGTIPDDGDQAAYMWVWEPAAPDNLSRFSNAPTIFNRTVIDKRGSSTIGNAKPSLNLETRGQSNDEEEDIAFLGMPEHSDWVLYAPFSFDPSLLHNPFMYALSNNIGRYAVRNKPVEMFVKSTSGALSFTNLASGDYYGVYNVMEKIRRNSDRVDIKKLEMYDNDPVSKTGGYIWKVDRIDAGDTGFTTGGQTMAFYYPKERELKSPQRDPQEQYLASATATVGYIAGFNAALQKTTFTDPVLGYAPYLDVDAAIDHHLLNVWSFNVDALRLSGFWTKDRGGKMYPGPIWDFDRTLSSTDGRDANPKMWRSNSGDLGTDFFNYIWWNRLFRDPDFYQKYIDRWQSLRRDGAFAPTAINGLLDDLNSQMSAEAVARDLKRWNNAKRSWTVAMGALNPVTTASQAAEVQRLKDYLQVRATWMDTQWVAPPATVTASGYVSPGTQVTLTGPAAGTIYYTTNGTDPRPGGGAAPGAGATAYTGPITISANTTLRARVYNAAFTALTGANNPPLVSKWSGSLDRTYTIDPLAVPGDIVISEINYHPSDPTPAELAINAGWGDKDFEFVEIRNVSGHIVSLNAAGFTAGITYPFTGAASRSLGVGETLVIAANPAAFAARYGAAVTPVGPYSGDLANSSETITLTSSLNLPIASVTYSDKWAPTTDGGGFSLVVFNLNPDDVNAGAAWKASAAANGSPGAWDAASLAFTAGPDVTSGGALTLSGTVLGNLSAGAPVWAWSKTSGPGNVTFGTAGALATTATASQNGTYILRLSLTYNGVTSYDELKAVISSTVETLDTWLAAHPGIGTAADDFEKDGRNNLEEFAFNTDPSVPNGGEPPVFTIENDKMVVTYPRRKAGSGVAYSVEISNDLGTFRLPKAGELTEVITGDDGVMETVKVTDTVTRTAEPRRFLRLKMVTIP
ncbi:MAG: CotH kinase family protein [Verrucomicrobiota bacterium]